jgi:hypothetical protein
MATHMILFGMTPVFENSRGPIAADWFQTGGQSLPSVKKALGQGPKKSDVASLRDTCRMLETAVDPDQGIISFSR